ncbi:hypothetical protein MPC91_003499 [Salmonella enterica]|nr:hypothetical protein [Salmonella enterica]EBN7382829.1 hypothetical protein [Salmonella enterica]EBR7475277.1 hypothetical protein [Salmonella enterica]EIZ6823581.1 hypothetical protein [Salmonella enterica]EKH9091413.1 hypothetical protein [Salmonella enterica]
MKAKEFLNSHKLVVISDFIKSIEAIPAHRWLYDFMQDELAYLIERGESWAAHDDDVPVDMVRSAAWLIAISKSHSGNYPVKHVVNPSQIIKAWRERNDAKQYSTTLKISIDTGDAQAALAALEEQIQSSSALKVLSGAVRDGAEPYYGVATLCSTESSGSIEQQTLSIVLGNALHSIPTSNASSVAVELAQAVKAAFDVLENKNATTR